MAKQKYCEDHYERLTELALEVYKLWKRGVDVTANAIKQNAEYRKLNSAASIVGITWQEVQIAAGIPSEEIIKKKVIHSKYSMDHYNRLTELALIVYELKKNGMDVFSGAIQKSLKYRKLLSAATYMNITWQEVLVAAGLSSDEIIKKPETREWSKDHYERLTELALEVCKLWKSGVDVSSGAIQKNLEYRKLISAATIVGISWQEVLVAAGISLTKVMKDVKTRLGG